MCDIGLILKIILTCYVVYILDSLTGAKLFTTLDLKSAYAKFPIAEEHKFKTAFLTPMGLLEYNCTCLMVFVRAQLHYRDS